MKYEEIEGGKEYRAPWNGVTYAFLSWVTYAFVVCGVTYTFLLGIMYTLLLEVTYTFVCIRRVNMKVSDDHPDNEEYYDNDSDNDNHQIPYFSHIAICRFRVNSCCKQFKRRIGIYHPHLSYTLLTTVHTNFHTGTYIWINYCISKVTYKIGKILKIRGNKRK